ncbi:MAG: glycyl-radical enzyme activating protein [Chloroflexi bacterium]|nr:glycyl-radical enzyme activating protein [Chloroflexota bacterium]
MTDTSLKDKRQQVNGKSDMEQEGGLVFLVQRYSLQDGPGLRTTVFMKGCPLNCRWCQNPESVRTHPELMTRDSKCVRLGRCAAACPSGAIVFQDAEGMSINREKCNLCFDCIDACPAGALRKVGDYLTIDQVMAEIERDELFYLRSGGGITVSGGEPLLQWPFVGGLLRACKSRGWHTALDTCGFAPWRALEKVLEHVDLVLYDIKHMDPRRHKEATGRSNRLILENVRRVPRNIRVWLRLPLIPGYNDSETNLRLVAQLAHEIGAEKVSILPFNRLAEGKYEQLGRPYAMAQTAPPSDVQLRGIQSFIESFGLMATIGS